MTITADQFRGRKVARITTVLDESFTAEIRKVDAKRSIVWVYIPQEDGGAEFRLPFESIKSVAAPRPTETNPAPSSVVSFYPAFVPESAMVVEDSKASRMTGATFFSGVNLVEKVAADLFVQYRLGDESRGSAEKDAEKAFDDAEAFLRERRKRLGKPKEKP